MVQAFRGLLGSLRERGDTTVFLSSHVLAEVEATCDRIGVIRGGRMVATGTIDELRRSAARRVVVDFRQPVSEPIGTMPGIRLCAASPRKWVFEVQGPLGPLIEALSALPVHDIHVDAFKLEDYVARHYSGS
jgi:ABC-2 type transport system ATP-binding protein